MSRPLSTALRCAPGRCQRGRSRGGGAQKSPLKFLSAANAVIVWNTVYMQAALEALREEGYPVREEELGHLSPARFAHIYRYGRYHFDLDAARSRPGLRPLRR